MAADLQAGPAVPRHAKQAGHKSKQGAIASKMQGNINAHRSSSNAVPASPLYCLQQA